jgi:hypothetical protein
MLTTDCAKPRTSQSTVLPKVAAHGSNAATEIVDRKWVRASMPGPSPSARQRNAASTVAPRAERLRRIEGDTASSMTTNAATKAPMLEPIPPDAQNKRSARTTSARAPPHLRRNEQ